MSNVESATADPAVVPRRSARTRAAILDAARQRFAEHGYERTTIRAVAADAAIDPSMVMRYFGNKAQLFDAALAVDLRLPDVSALSRDELPSALVRHFLDRWEGEPSDDALLLLLRSGVTNDHAAERLRAIFAAQVAPVLSRLVDPSRVGLLSAQLLGLALARYLLRIPTVVGLTRDDVVSLYSPAIAALLAPAQP
jgi:AcrR family transcriptional regulator